MLSLPTCNIHVSLLILVFFGTTPSILHSQILNIEDGGTVITCDAQLVDDGGPENYSNNSNDLITICSENEECLNLDFIELEVQSIWDSLYVYEGTEVSGEPLASYSGSFSGASLDSYSDCVTFLFVSNGTGNESGFIIDITCADCPTCEDGIQNGAEQGIDCGGPHCEPCPCEDVTISDIPFMADSTTCGAPTFDGENVCGPPFVTAGAVITYVYTPGEDEVILMEFTDFIAGSGIAQVTAGCPTDPDSDCMGVYQAATGETSISQILTLSDGVSYYFSLYTNSFDANCTDFQFTLSSSLPPPTEQDCLGALEVCDFIYVQEQFYSGDGNYPNEINPETSCFISQENNSVWYTFTVLESGILNFVIEPFLDDSDYDWALFDLTDATCEDIFSDEDILVSCNTWGSTIASLNGPTGISSSMGGIDDSNGPGEAGELFNEDVEVVAGQTFVLYIENWVDPNTPASGYTLDFSGSTAQLFYPGPPTVAGIDPVNCRELRITMSEPVDCDSISLSTFSILPVDDEVDVPLVDSISTGCMDDGSTTVVTFYFSDPMPDEPTEYELTVSSESGAIVDLCGNLLTEDGADTTLTFTTPQWMSIASEITDTECLEEIGAIDFSAIFGGTQPFIYRFEGEEVDEAIAQGLGAGTYLVDITDALGCHHDQEFTVYSNIEEVDIVMPNIFTPNDDTFNDRYGPKAISRETGEGLGLIDYEKHLGQYRLEVYNRWGNEVFLGTLSSPFWDGTMDGEAVQDGTYFYVLTMTKTCTEIDPEQKTFKGTITILR